MAVMYGVHETWPQNPWPTYPTQPWPRDPGAGEYDLDKLHKLLAGLPCAVCGFPNADGGDSHARCREAIERAEARACKEHIPSTGLKRVAEDVGREVGAAMAAFPPFNSAHEGYAVLDEERDELWQHVKVKQGQRDIAKMRKEAIQVAAMAIRFVVDVCDGGRGQK